MEDDRVALGYSMSRLEITLTDKEEGTRLDMIHSKVPAEQVASYSSGWKYFAKKSRPDTDQEGQAPALTLASRHLVLE